MTSLKQLLEFDRWGHRHGCLVHRHGMAVTTQKYAPRGITALFGLGAINRGGCWPWGLLSTLGTLCPCLESAWEPSNSYIYSDHPIELESDSSALH